LTKKRKAELLIHEKLAAPKGMVREIKIWKVNNTECYPDGIRYRLVFVNTVSGFVHLLYDNHWPKGHHVHEADTERFYEFISIGRLLEDFKKRSNEIEGVLNES
jgi:hypothetical protein